MTHQEKKDLIDLWQNEMTHIFHNSNYEITAISKLKLKRIAKEITEFLEEEK